MAKPMRVLICGVPNVGKSTLINTLTNKRHAKTGDEAGITKLEQRARARRRELAAIVRANGHGCVLQGGHAGALKPPA
jgi:predicted GTPase